MNAKLDSILETVGNTPIVRLRRLSPPGFNVFAKVEAFNPMGSVKDRLALGIRFAEVNWVHDLPRPAILA